MARTGGMSGAVVAGSLAAALAACGEPARPPGATSGSGGPSARSAAPSAAPQTPPSASVPPITSSPRSSSAYHHHGSNNRELYAYAVDVPKLVEASAGSPPRFLRVELRPDGANVLAVTEKDPKTIKSYTITGGAVTNVETPSAIMTAVFQTKDVDWAKLPEKAAEGGMQSGIDYEERMISMVILPGPAGAKIHFTVSHSSPRAKDEYDGPAK